MSTEMAFTDEDKHFLTFLKESKRYASIPFLKQFQYRCSDSLAAANKLIKQAMNGI